MEHSEENSKRTFDYIAEAFGKSPDKESGSDTLTSKVIPEEGKTILKKWKTKERPLVKKIRELKERKPNNLKPRGQARKGVKVDNFFSHVSCIVSKAKLLDN
jgi:hypothetical protein